jgi:hypothetical protein
VTGDIDNLGRFVALNGRAKGENLVDHYTSLLDQFLGEWRQKQGSGLIEFCFIPAGEEVSIFGVAKRKSISQSLFNALRSEFPRLLKRNHGYLGSKDTSVTFGFQIFDQPHIRKRIGEFIHRSKRLNNQDIYADYLAVLELIRTQLALRVDQAKFRDLIGPRKSRATLLRRYVYFKVIQYKRETAKELPQIVNVLGPNVSHSEKLDKGIDQAALIKFTRIQKRLTK